MLAKKASLRVRDSDGRTALDYAIMANNLDLVELILINGEASLDLNN